MTMKCSASGVCLGVPENARLHGFLGRGKAERKAIQIAILYCNFEHQ